MKIYLVLLVVLVILGLIGLMYWRSRYLAPQTGGESVWSQQLPPETSQRHHPLGYLSSDGYVEPETNIPVVAHASPSVTHSHNMVNTKGCDYRKPSEHDYLYRHTFDWQPYDWRPFEWRPYWLRRADLCPSAKNCSEYATDQCIGTGQSDYQTCYDREKYSCPHKKSNVD
jgi:hypothetical protein